MTKYRIEFDRNKCIGAGFCVKVNPEFWRMEKDGKSMLSDSEQVDSKFVAFIDDADLKTVKESALVCPSYAIDIINLKTKKDILGIRPTKEGAKIINAHYDSRKEWIMDKKGFFTIKPFPEEGVIRVRYYDAKHRLRLVIEGKNAEEIYNTIVREKLISRLDHAAYLGSELQKAELAMKYNKKYVQDDPLSL